MSDRARALLLRAQGHLERAGALITSSGLLLPDPRHQSTCEASVRGLVDITAGLVKLRVELEPKRGGK